MTSDDAYDPATSHTPAGEIDLSETGSPDTRTPQDTDEHLSVAVDALKQDADDPRHLKGRDHKLLVKRLSDSAAVPAITAYREPANPSTFIAVQGAPYLSALREAGIACVNVTVKTFSEADVLAYFVGGEPDVSMSKVEKAVAGDQLVEAFADHDHPLAAAAHKATVGVDQLRNYQIIAAVKRCLGPDAAEAFPADAAPKLRVILAENDKAWDQITADDLHQAKARNGWKSDVNAGVKVVEKDPADAEALLADAGERASGGSAAVLPVWKMVLRCYEAGMSPETMQAALSGATGHDHTTSAPGSGTAATAPETADDPGNSAALDEQDEPAQPQAAAAPTGSTEATEEPAEGPVDAEPPAAAEPAQGGDAVAAPEADAAEPQRQARPTPPGRRKGQRHRRVLNRRRFVECAENTDLDGHRSVPGPTQEAALAAVNERARALGLVNDDETYLRRVRIYQMENGQETGGTVELALIVHVCGTARPVLESPDGGKVVTAVRREMQRLDLKVPPDLEAAHRAQAETTDPDG